MLSLWQISTSLVRERGFNNWYLHYQNFTSSTFAELVEYGGIFGMEGHSVYSVSDKLPYMSDLPRTARAQKGARQLIQNYVKFSIYNQWAATLINWIIKYGWEVQSYMKRVGKNAGVRGKSGVRSKSDLYGITFSSNNSNIRQTNDRHPIRTVNTLSHSSSNIRIYRKTSVTCVSL